MINAIDYDADSVELINKKLSQPDLKSANWSDEDIIDLKGHIKKFYIAEQQHRCAFCNQIIRSTNGRHWDIEHIIPRDTCAYFMFASQNLCVSCIDCNSNKGVKKVTSSKAKKRLPNKSENYLIYHPHFDNYDDHLVVIKEGVFYQARSAKGEQTMYVCGLSRFYDFAGYDKTLSSDARILLLAKMLGETDDEEVKNGLYKEIASLTLVNLVNK